MQTVELVLQAFDAVERRDYARQAELFHPQAEFLWPASLPYQSGWEQTCAGTRFACPVLGLYQVRDGKLARAQMFYFDTTATAEFLTRACALGELQHWLG